LGRRAVDAMRHATSPSQQRRFGVDRVCQEWGVARSTCSHQRCCAEGPPREPAKRGPKTSDTDEALTDHIRQGLAASPFLGEGPRQGWARLRVPGIRTAKLRGLRLMRQAGRSAPSRAPRAVGPRAHDGPITTERPHQRWGTDATSTVTLEDGPVTGFVAIDHCTLEGVGLHAATRAPASRPWSPAAKGAGARSGPSRRGSRRACRSGLIRAASPGATTFKPSSGSSG
jgi:hypothetical protein